MEDNHSKEPWLEDPASLPNNRCAVEATFLRMEKHLAKEPVWKAAYSTQVQDRRAAVKWSQNTITKWGGPVWYVTNLIVPNPYSVTTLLSLIWNSSQRFRGVSMNDLLLKVINFLNQICAVLLRFRSGVLGDIKKIYDSLWLEDREMHLPLMRLCGWRAKWICGHKGQYWRQASRVCVKLPICHPLFSLRKSAEYSSMTAMLMTFSGPTMTFTSWSLLWQR